MQLMISEIEILVTVYRAIGYNEFAIKRGLSSLDKPGYVNRHCCKINNSCLIHLFDFACAVATSFTCLTQS